MNPDKIMLEGFAATAQLEPLAVTSNPFSIALGMILLEARPLPGKVVLQFNPEPLFVQGAGVLQGGALSAMVDFAMAFATLVALPAGSTATTTTLDVAYLRAAKPGRYQAIGEVEQLGRRIAFARARLVALDGDMVVVTASSSLLILPER